MGNLYNIICPIGKTCESKIFWRNSCIQSGLTIKNNISVLVSPICLAKYKQVRDITLLKVELEVTNLLMIGCKSVCFDVTSQQYIYIYIYIYNVYIYFIFYSILDSEYRLSSFKTWICLLIVCFLFCDGVRSTLRNVLLMFLFNLICLGNINKILI